MNVEAYAPMRVDLAGGTLDIPPLYLFHTGSLTINMAITRYARVHIGSSDYFRVISHDQQSSVSGSSPQEVSWHQHPELELLLRVIHSFDLQNNATIEVSSEVPAGSGLGGSSAIAIALSAALAQWMGRYIAKEELIERAKSLETQVIKVPAGYQDYWGAVYGGLHTYEFDLAGKMNKTALCSDAFSQTLEDHLLLVYTTKHFSGTNNWELFKKHMDGHKPTYDFFERLKDNAILMKEALEKEDMNLVARVLNKDWETRKCLARGITTPEIEDLTSYAFQHGSIAARACGAGGGGCVALLVDPKKKPALEQDIAGRGMKIIPCKIDQEGLRVFH